MALVFFGRTQAEVFLMEIILENTQASLLLMEQATFSVLLTAGVLLLWR